MTDGELARERRLIRAAQHGDPRAREQLVAAQLEAVRKVARGFHGLGLDDDDLVQEGSVGLLDAIDRYEPSRGLPFGVYARCRVRRAIQNALTETSRLVRLPKHVVEHQRATARASSRLFAATGRAPTPDEISIDTGLPVRAILDAGAARATSLPLDDLVELPAELRSFLDPEAVLLADEEASLLARNIASLPPRQRLILTRHYGFGGPAETFREIASRLDLSASRTETLEHQAISRLHRELSAQDIGPVHRRGSVGHGSVS